MENPRSIGASSSGKIAAIPNPGYRGIDLPPSGQIVTEPPFLCIEILSRSDRMPEMQERIDDYLEFGVRYVWLINPRTRRAVVYSGEGVREVKDGILYTANPDPRVSLAELD